MEKKLKNELCKFLMDLNNDIVEEALLDDEFDKNGNPYPACGMEWIADRLPEINNFISQLE